MTVTRLADHRRTTRPSCAHFPTCPAATALDDGAARVIACHPEQGWSLLCNGVVAFDDCGEILPSGICVAPQHRPERALRRVA